MKTVIKKEVIVGNKGNRAEKSQTANYLVYFLSGIVELALVFRFILKLTGANPTSGFVTTIYSLTQTLIAPFEGIFRLSTTKGIETTAVLEPATIVALAVYAVLAWTIIQLIIIVSGKVRE